MHRIFEKTILPRNARSPAFWPKSETSKILQVFDKANEVELGVKEITAVFEKYVL